MKSQSWIYEYLHSYSCLFPSTGAITGLLNTGGCTLSADNVGFSWALQANIRTRSSLHKRQSGSWSPVVMHARLSREVVYNRAQTFPSRVRHLFSHHSLFHPSTAEFLGGILGKSANYLPSIFLLKPLRARICTCACIPACLCIWARANVCIISAWGCCNYTVKVPMGRHIWLRATSPRFIMSCVWETDRKTAVCVSV